MAWLLASTMPCWAQTQVVTPEQPASGDIRKYCTNIAVAASDARVAYQTEKLGELETRIKARAQELDAKTAETRGWIERREAIEKKAADKLIGIYSKMKPETAAAQIALLDDDMAAAIISQLNPRQASLIFNELVPERAGKLAVLMVGGPQTDKKM